MSLQMLIIVVRQPEDFAPDCHASIAITMLPSQSFTDHLRSYIDIRNLGIGTMNVIR
jgi:hypothetical protein